MRNIIIGYIEIIEVKLRSLFAFHLASAYGSECHLDGKYFIDQIAHKEIIDKVDVIAKRNKIFEPAIAHFVDNLKMNIPIWLFVESMTIAQITKLYGIIIDSQIKELIANNIFVKKDNKDSKILLNQMWELTNIRNLCAHGSRLYNKVFLQRPKLSRIDKSLLIKNANGSPNNDRLYGFILNMRYLLNEEQMRKFKKDINDLCSKFPFVNLKYYGFREDWNEML